MTQPALDMKQPAEMSPSQRVGVAAEVSVQPVESAESRSDTGRPVQEWEVLAGAATPTWPLPGDNRSVEWECLGRYPTYLAANIIAGRLECEGVPAIVEAFTAFPDHYGAKFWIPRPLAHRVRWIMSWPSLTDAELTYLATGELLANIAP